MTGILLVSHSKQLAEGLAQLLHGVAGEDLLIETVGGMKTLGVDATRVLEGIDDLTDLGCTTILIFGDLGSAFLAAETARDLMQGSDIRVIDAPFVEGSLAACMVLSMGSSAEEAIAAAEEAYQIRKR
ncbi:PTS-dependent dihydroxyacetone kinase phosphotransferase subunit DhaM [Sulfobacillus thermosulfidooxidans]|uniref:PTS-dependent dihydroxyacetone kinase phosphotransferase subunit DhaM n=1 Tax=Sulfobacillus thermosulfidooxidans TaxID=28034 RepID=UPI00096BA985|nr:hypothetical protein [Sulfobacillus thermosulfidooxidans]OLZ11575.1 hypothetical protein BFX05_06130 [Sulfobacillus thermosulfidooxidans]OLZ17417.1 hypothetical protein BFX06_13560 [Sulfobacillus thermosulfidooxidans]OLZ21073.1 hypothetical protein BFX07_13735 [Sulfobacillus thermosulfidooxidans]